MARAEDEEKDIEIPSDEDENFGEGAPRKKREKRRKSKEERMAERRVIFWTLVIVLLITLGFWLVPRVGDLISGKPVEIKTDSNDKNVPGVDKPAKTNYKEITL
jgi:hypothetical protein